MTLLYERTPSSLNSFGSSHLLLLEYVIARSTSYRKGAGRGHQGLPKVHFFPSPPLEKGGKVGQGSPPGFLAPHPAKGLPCRVPQTLCPLDPCFARLLNGPGFWQGHGSVLKRGAILSSFQHILYLAGHHKSENYNISLKLWPVYEPGAWAICSGVP